MVNKKYAYMNCPKCKTRNRLDLVLDKSGNYSCSLCKSHLLLVTNKPRMRAFSVVIACFIGIGGYGGYKHFEDKFKPNGVQYSQLNTTWTPSQVEQLERKCKANFAQRYVNWSSGKIEKTCTCLVESFAQSMSNPSARNLDRDMYEENVEQCAQE